MVRRRLAALSTALFTKLGRAQMGESGPGLRVNRLSRLTPTTSCGHDVHTNGLTVTGRADVRIGSHFHTGTGCRILTDIHEYEGTELPYDSSVRSQPVDIGDNVWLGLEVIVLGGVTIGEGAIVQARSVVVSDVAPLAIVGGHPAQQFSERDADHYWKLRSEQKCCAAP